MAGYVTPEKRLVMALKLHQMTAPTHAFLATPEGCGRCPTASPFRWNEEVHPYVIEEEPC